MLPEVRHRLHSARGDIHPNSDRSPRLLVQSGRNGTDAPDSLSKESVVHDSDDRAKRPPMLPVTTVTLGLPDQAATEALAARLAAQARPGDCILLEGPLGAGKSTFARAFIRAAAGEPDLEVPSPTFTLVQAYDTSKGEIFHYDLW